MRRSYMALNVPEKKKKNSTGKEKKKKTLLLRWRRSNATHRVLSIFSAMFVALTPTAALPFSKVAAVLQRPTRGTRELSVSPRTCASQRSL